MTHGLYSFRVKIPEIYGELTSRNVLTMEFVEGVDVGDTQGVEILCDMVICC